MSMRIVRIKRALTWVLSAVLLAGFLASCSGGEPKLVACACGAESGDNVTFELAVGMVRSDMDSPQLDANLNPMWDLWVQEHYEMRNSAGELTPMSRVVSAKAIPQRKITGAEEFFIRAVLKKGETYTLDIIPMTGGAIKYRHQFTASSQDFPFSRRYFDQMVK